MGNKLRPSKEEGKLTENIGYLSNTFQLNTNMQQTHNNTIDVQ
jgi:hypothetical protein